MTNKQIGIPQDVYDKFMDFVGDLTKIEKHHITAGVALDLLLDFYKARMANDILVVQKPPAGARPV